MFENVIKGLTPLLKEGTAPDAVIGVLKGIDLNDTIQDKDVAAKLLETNEHLKSARDAFFSQGIETWKKNHYEKDLKIAVDEELKRQGVKLTEDQKKFKELEDRIVNSEKELLKERMLNKATLLADELKIPTALKGYILPLISDDEKTTLDNVKAFSKSINQVIQSVTEEFIKKHGVTPGTGGKEPIPDDIDKQIEAARAAANWPMVIDLMDKKKRG